MYKSVFIIKDSIKSIDVLFTGSQKSFQIHYEICLEMAGSVFSVLLDALLPLY